MGQSSPHELRQPLIEEWYLNALAITPTSYEKGKPKYWGGKKVAITDESYCGHVPGLPPKSTPMSEWFCFSVFLQRTLDLNIYFGFTLVVEVFTAGSVMKKPESCRRMLARP